MQRPVTETRSLDHGRAAKQIIAEPCNRRVKPFPLDIQQLVIDPHQHKTRHDPAAADNKLAEVLVVSQQQSPVALCLIYQCSIRCPGCTSAV